MDPDFPVDAATPAAGLPTTRRQAREQAGRPYRTRTAAPATNPSGVRTAARTSGEPAVAPAAPSPAPAAPSRARAAKTGALAVSTGTSAMPIAASVAPASASVAPPRISGDPSRSGRRAQPSAPEPSGPGGKHTPLLLATVVAVVGAVLVVVGALQATVFKPAAVTTATLSAPGTPVVSTAVGVLGLDGPRITATATAAGSGPVFIGIGRAADVDAYLAQAARQEVTGQHGGKLVARHAGRQTTLPDPAGVDVWVISTRSTGKATLSWPDTKGQWRMVVATNGASPAPSVSFTWSGRTTRSKAPQLISIGLVLAIGGLIMLIVLFSRARMSADDDEEDPA